MYFGMGKRYLSILEMPFSFILSNFSLFWVCGWKFEKSHFKREQFFLETGQFLLPYTTHFKGEKFPSYEDFSTLRPQNQKKREKRAKIKESAF
jgi:hypothetical protein